MDTQQFGLVFPPPPSPQGAPFRRPPSTHDMAWQPTPHVSSLSSSSPNHDDSSHMYPPAPLSGGDQYAQTDFLLRPANSFVAESDYSSGSSTDTNARISFDSPQVESSVGPRRTSRRATQSASGLEWDGYHDRPQGSLALVRADTEPDIPPDGPESLSSASRQLFFSGDYTRYPTLSHNRSTSDSGTGSLSTPGSNPRSASPALSIASVVTSHSSVQSVNQADKDSYAPELWSGPSRPLVARPKHQKRRLFAPQRREICLYQQKHPGAKQEEIAAHFGVERSTVSKILKYKDKWLSVNYDDVDAKGLVVAKSRPSKFPELEDKLIDWIAKKMDKRELLTDRKIREMAKIFAAEYCLGEDRFKASSGWIENFKHRHGIKRGIWHNDGQVRYEGYLPAGVAGLHAAEPPPPPPPQHLESYRPRPIINPVAPAYRRPSFGPDGDDEVMEQQPPPHATGWQPEIPEENHAHITIEPIPIIHRGEDGQERTVYVQPEAPPVSDRPPTPTLEEARHCLRTLRVWSLKEEAFLREEETHAIISLMIAVEDRMNGLPARQQ